MPPRRCRRPQGRYLEHTAAVTPRFSEVDSLRIVWHGHFITYFEDARVAFGRKYGIGYDDIRDADLIAPVVHISCDYLSPARYGDELEVLARLYKRESAKIEFHYEIMRKSDGVLLAAGQSVQAFADLNGDLLLTLPEFMTACYDRWEDSMAESDE